MNLIETTGDLFSVPQGYYLAHCISADFALGAGIAKKMDGIYDMKKKLEIQYARRKGFVGTSLCIDNVFNLVIKKGKYDTASYDDLLDALYEMRDEMERKYIRKLAMPHIGCNKEGFDWNKVRDMLDEAFHDMDVDILVYSL